MDLHLNEYGTYLHVREGMLEVVRRDKQKGELRTQVAIQRVRQILLHEGTSLSADAVKLCMQNNVDIVFLDTHGGPMGRIWHSKLGSTTKIRKAQLKASMSAEGCEWIRKWLQAKIQGQIDHLWDLGRLRAPHKDYLAEQAGKLASYQMRFVQTTPCLLEEVADTWRGWEGNAGRVYFETLSTLLAKEYKFDGRSFRPAKDAFNAFLNYAYGILYHQVEKALMVAGIDPYVGFMHRDDYNQVSMVYDFIEPYRIHANRVVFGLFSAKKINQSHWTPIAQGVGITTDGKRLLVQQFSTYFREEKVKHRQRQLSRAHVLQLDAHAFAQALLKQFNEEQKTEQDDIVGVV